jgi:hypothetical protein
MVLRLIVLKLNVQAVLDADLHLDAVVDLRLTPEVLDCKIELLYDVGVQSRACDRHAHEVPGRRTESATTIVATNVPQRHLSRKRQMILAEWLAV